MADVPVEFIALQGALSGRYSLERELGRGGMGIVFLARDVALNRRVAIKLLPPEVAQDDSTRERFLREARAAGGLFHPNIVPIHLVETYGDLVYFVMAFVDGESVGQRVRRAGPMSPSAVARLVQEVAWALGYAHEKGVIHRDIKPDNILLERPGGRALVADFGIALVMQRSGATSRGEVLGTLAYMSPEQATGEEIDGRSDLYALGATACFALTGRPPFEAPSALAMIQHHVSTPSPRLAVLVRNLPPRLAEAIDRCMAKTPPERFPTGEALASAVSDSAAPQPTLPPEVRRILRRIRVASVVFGIGSTAVFTVGVLGRDLVTAIAQEWFTLALLCVIPALAVLRGTWRLVKDLRQSIRRGYDIDLVHQTLQSEARAMIEEGMPEIRARAKDEFVDEDQEAGRREGRNVVLTAGRKRDTNIRHGPVFALLSAMLLAGGFTSFQEPNPQVILLGALAFGASLMAVGAGPPVGRDSPLVALDWGERLLVGRFGQLMFRLARIGLGRSIAAPARTEVALAAAIGDLVTGLPADVIDRIGDVRGTIAALERHAASLREREQRVSDALARVDPQASHTDGIRSERLREELENSRGAVRQRLATTVAAIEAIRLDLLRLHAGVGTTDSLTALLERARDIASAVDAELSAREEVKRLLTDVHAAE